MSRSIIADQINKALSMRMVVEKYGIPISRAGFISCPFHNEKTPSLKIYNEIGRGFYCFGCGQGGDVIKFIQKYLNLTFPQALQRIKSDFGIGEYMDMRETREWQKRQRAIERDREKKAKARHIQEQINATEANKLRDQVLENNEIIKNNPPIRSGTEIIFPDAWVQAIKKRDELNYMFNERLEGIQHE